MSIRNVLIVDDSKTELMFLSEMLKKAGFAVTTAENAEDAQRRLEQAKPDLILMDVVMPGQNGFQLTRAISRDPRYTDIPIIMCTSKNQETDRVWGMRQGARDYITKPVNPAIVLARVRTHLALYAMQQAQARQQVVARHHHGFRRQAAAPDPGEQGGTPAVADQGVVRHHQAVLRPRGRLRTVGHHGDVGAGAQVFVGFDRGGKVVAVCRERFRGAERCVPGLGRIVADHGARRVGRGIRSVEREGCHAQANRQALVFVEVVGLDALLPVGGHFPGVVACAIADHHDHVLGQGDGSSIVISAAGDECQRARQR